MKKILGFLCGAAVLILSACDLQPKITSLPDNVGEFISARYPALLADPDTQPEIYNSAVSDYGVYASPELYGSGGMDEYVLYSSIDDYTLKPAVEILYTDNAIADAAPELMLTTVTPDDYLQIPGYQVPVKTVSEIIVVKGDTLYSLSRQYAMSVDALAKTNNLSAPYSLSVGQKLKTSFTGPAITIVKPVVPSVAIVAPPVKAAVMRITVSKGDTMYSLSRKYSLPVNDLAVMNKLSSPFVLSLGQKLKVPHIVTVASKTLITATVPVKKTVTATTTSTKLFTTTPKEKISSDPSQKLAAITKRSSSKFSWPVRGTVLSGFGAKSNGLHNDGVNISAKVGTKIGAAENGVVAYAGNEVKGMGNLVIVQHSDGWMTVYAHMDKLSVRRGVKVGVGQQVGTVGQTGKVDKPQLHFEIRKGTKAYDPVGRLSK